MSSNPGDALTLVPRRRWGMTTWLTLHYTVSIVVLLVAASAFLYWELARHLEQQEQDYLRQKMQVLRVILEKRPFDRSGLDQEAEEEAGISSRSRSPFYLRVLDAGGTLVAESPGMAANIPLNAFPTADASGLNEGVWRSADASNFLVASDFVPSPQTPTDRWRIQGALNVSADQDLLARYRFDIGAVLLVGLLVAATIAVVITRRGLRPLANITRATERIGAQQLQERIRTGPWPSELVSLAAAFDQMLDRLQDSFERLSQFSADLAHELRSPINNLMGEAQVALSQERSAGEYARVLHSALEEHGRLARMIDSMLFLAQADQARAAPSLAPLDAGAELRKVAEFYQALADEQGVDLVCTGRCDILADPLLLRRALSNLLSNALRYTPRGGRVTLHAAGSLPDERSVSVIDTGTGIAAEHLPRIADRFYRVDPSRANSQAGSGLGLAIVKSIMELHGGQLRIDSVVGKGTIATLVFPPPGSGAIAV
jgi:two-component system heavy metal sensor histidine kinase CusS